MSSRLSSTNSLSDGGLTARPKPRRVLSADGRRRRNARNRRRQKRKRKALRAKDDISSDLHTPSTISLSLTPSEINQAKQLNPVVAEKQHNVSADIVGEIDNILKVLHNDNSIHSSPTAIVKTVLEDTNNVHTSRLPSDVEVPRQAPVEQYSVPDSHATAHFQLAPADIIEPLQSSREQAIRTGTDVLQSEQEPFEGKVHAGQNVPARGSNVMAEVRDTGQVPNALRGQQPNSSRAGRALGLPLLEPSGNDKSNTTTSKRRRVDVDYTFAESQTAPVTSTSLHQGSHASIRESKELLSESIKSSDADGHNQIGTVVKSQFLDDILDLEKGVEFRLPEMDESNMTGVGVRKVSNEMYPVQVNGDIEQNLAKAASRDEAEQESAKNVADEGKANKGGVEHACYSREDQNLIRMKNSAVNDVSKIVAQGTPHLGEELENEVGNTSNLFEKSGKPPAASERTPKAPKENSTGKRMRGTSSVSAALRFARKQKILQPGLEVKPKGLEQDVHAQESIVWSPNPTQRKKRKRKKKKTTQPLDARGIINERQYNESVLLGFRNEAGDYGVQAGTDCNVDFMLPSPSLLEDTVNAQDPCLFTSTSKEKSPENVTNNHSYRRGDDDENLANEDHGSLEKAIKPGTDGSHSAGGQDIDCERSAAGETPPPVTEVDEETPFQYGANAKSGSEVLKERQSKGKRREKSDRRQDLLGREGKTALLDNNSTGEDLPAEIEPVVPAVEYESSAREPPQPTRVKDQHSSSSLSKHKSDELDFEGKRKFFDDMVTSMLDTTVELEFFCKDLFRMKCKVRDESPP